MALDFVAGCIGGGVGVLLGHPFDTIKVRLQTENHRKYRNTIQTFKYILKNEGAHGFYKGMASPLYGMAGINAIVFGVYGNVLRQMPDNHSLQSYFIAGCTAGFSQSLICSPMELAKTLMQNQGEGQMRKKGTSMFKSPLECLTYLFKKEGFRGLCRGGIATVVRETPAFGLYFSSYEYFVENFPKEPDQKQSASALLVSGGLAGMLSWISIYPIDVIKTRLQTDLTGKYNSVLHCITKSYKNEGISVFFRGLTATLLRAFPVNAVTFVVVHWVLKIPGTNENADIDKSNLATDRHNLPHALV